MIEGMPAPRSIPPPSVVGLTLTLDPTSPALPATLETLRARPGLTLREPRMPFAALALESDDTRRDHAWLESLPAVIAVDVVFIEVLAEPETGIARTRRRSRDPLDDSPLPGVTHPAASCAGASTS